MDDSESMLRAIELAKQAALLEEVPVGAVVTHNGMIAVSYTHLTLPTMAVV